MLSCEQNKQILKYETELRNLLDTEFNNDLVISFSDPNVIVLLSLYSKVLREMFIMLYTIEIKTITFNGSESYNNFDKNTVRIYQGISINVDEHNPEPDFETNMNKISKFINISI